jgi:hypothetical protein
MMDDQEPLLKELLKELRGLRADLASRYAEREKTKMFLVAVVIALGGLFLLAEALHGFGWF